MSKFWDHSFLGSLDHEVNVRRDQLNCVSGIELFPGPLRVGCSTIEPKPAAGQIRDACVVDTKAGIDGLEHAGVTDKQDSSANRQMTAKRWQQTARHAVFGLETWWPASRRDIAGPALVDFGAGEALPRSCASLTQGFVDHDITDAKHPGDDLRCSTRSLQVAGNDEIERRQIGSGRQGCRRIEDPVALVRCVTYQRRVAPVVVCSCQSRAQRIGSDFGLSFAEHGQRRVGLPLPEAAKIPFGLAVPDRQQLAVLTHGARP